MIYRLVEEQSVGQGELGYLLPRMVRAGERPRFPSFHAAGFEATGRLRILRHKTMTPLDALASTA